MNTRHILLGLVIVACSGATLEAVQLLPNSDFEVISVDEVGEPELDSVGNEQANDWFRDTNVDSGRPHTELISPNNLNNAAMNNLGDDSDGAGMNSAALNSVTFEVVPGVVVGLPTDWRSHGVATTPAERLIFSFDFKFEGVNDTNPGGSINEGFLAQMRSFDGIDESGSTLQPFRGETSPLILAKDFASDQWHSLSYRYIVPPGGNFSDVRMSANIFGSEQLSTGRVLLDKIAIHRLSADFDMDFDVDGDDLIVWQGAYSLNTTADADGDGDSDGADFLQWQREFGLGIGALDNPMTLPLTATIAVPEPITGALAVGFLLLTCGRSTPLVNLRKVCNGVHSNV